MTLEELKQELIYRLGGSTVKVELDDNDLNTAIDIALRWFSSKIGIEKSTIINVNNYVEYEIADLESVQDVIFEGGGYFNVDNYSVPYLGNFKTFSDFVLATEVAEQTQKYYGGAYWAQVQNKIVIGGFSGQVLIKYFAKVTRDNLTEVKNSYYLDLITRMALAQAKIILGRKRSKYSDLPSAQGTVTLDGSTLLDEANNEIEQLNEEANANALPVAIIIK